MLSSQQAVLDLVISVGGSADVLDGADGEQLIRAFTASAEERGRSDERAKAAIREAELASAIAKAKAEAEVQSRKAVETSLEKMKIEGLVRSKSQELADYISRENVRIGKISQIIAYKSQRRQWISMSLIWIGCAFVGVMGQFFIWQGLDWWTKSYWNIFLGVIVVIATIIATSMGLRIIPPGKIDLAGSLHLYLVKRNIKSRLRDMEHDGDRARVKDILEARFGKL